METEKERKILAWLADNTFSLINLALVIAAFLIAFGAKEGKRASREDVKVIVAEKLQTCAPRFELEQVKIQIKYLERWLDAQSRDIKVIEGRLNGRK